MKLTIFPQQVGSACIVVEGCNLGIMMRHCNMWCRFRPHYTEQEAGLLGGTALTQKQYSIKRDSAARRQAAYKCHI